MTAGRLAYVVSRFPLLTETFIVHEVIALRSIGWPVDMFAMRHEPQTVVHAEARQLESGVHFPRGRLVLTRAIAEFKQHPELWARLVRMIVPGAARSPAVLGKSMLVLPLAAAWAEQMRRLGVRHVHAHFGSYPALAALVAASLQDIGFSFTVHAHDLFADNALLAEKVHAAKFVVTISEFNRARLAALLQPGDERRIRVIRCGVDLTAFQFRPRVPPTADRTVLSVAALREYKGLARLIEACAMLRGTAPDQRFVCYIVGEGPERTALETQIRAAGLGDWVKLLGAREQPAIRSLLEQSDTFVLPSVVAHNRYMDGIPVALMEAMASGVPVVASDLSGIPELVRDEDTGLLVPPGNAEALHHAILRCWHEPRAAAARALRAHALVAREFDVQQNTAQLADEFDHVLRSGRAIGAG